MIGIAPDRRRRNQDRHWRLDCGRLTATWRRVEKVRLDRAFGGERRLEMTIVHELVEFGTIPGNAQTFQEFLELALLVFDTAQRLSAMVVESTIAA